MLSPFEPWNNPMYRDNPFAPHNHPTRRDNPSEPWNKPFGRAEDLKDCDDRKSYGLRCADDCNDEYER